MGVWDKDQRERLFLCSILNRTRTWLVDVCPNEVPEFTDGAMSGNEGPGSRVLQVAQWFCDLN